MGINKIFIYDNLKAKIKIENGFPNFNIVNAFIEINNNKLKIYGMVLIFEENSDNILEKLFRMSNNYKKIDTIICYDIITKKEYECYIFL